MGSPAYMSPEQCKDSADVDLRSDIYSFGIIMYEMLAGRTPYVAASGTEMLIMHLTATPGPLSELGADVPAHVEAAIKRALSRAREARFESIAEFMGALRGDVGASLPSPSGELPAFRVSGSERAVAAKSITTFSRATGEIGTAAVEEARLQATRHRRWPVIALGAVAVTGLALFLLVKPSHNPAPAATIDTPSVATKASAIAGASLRQESMGNPAQIAPAPPSGVDAGAVPPALAGASATAKPTQVAMPPAVAPPAVAGVPRHAKPARAAEPRHSPASRGEKPENQWLFLH
jgi:serine/threonine-protein kinase